MGNGLVQTLNYRTQKYLSALLMLIREAAARTFWGGGGSSSVELQQPSSFSHRA